MSRLDDQVFECNSGGPLVQPDKCAGAFTRIRTQSRPLNSGVGNQIELAVRDFGAGFDLSTTQGRGLGLTSMKERVRAVGGRLAILSEPQRGTTINASVPLVEARAGTHHDRQPEPQSFEG